MNRVRKPGFGGWIVDTGIPETALPALRVQIWNVVPIAFVFAAVERFFAENGTWGQSAACIGLAILTTIIPVYWGRFVPSWLRWPSQTEYLSNKDSELNQAIFAMCRHSAWAKWYAAQYLINSGKPISDNSFLNVAAHNITDNLTDGDIDVRGRPPGKLEYETIPRTHWRSSAIHFVRNATGQWKLTVVPRGGVEFDRDGTVVRAGDNAAVDRTSVIRNYDSLIVDSRQFERIWPKNERGTDRERYRFLREARRRNLDEAEIARLTQDWSFFHLLSWIK